MIFISYAQMARDVLAWSEQLPRDIDAFVAVPRSGIIPASILALHRNVRFGTVNEVAAGRLEQGGFRDQHQRLKKIMVVDDSILSGKSIQAALTRLKGAKIEIIAGAVYIKPGNLYLHYREVPMPRIFEWNWLHHYWMQKACVDIDGVLCQDPTRQQNDDGVLYKRFLATAGPKHLPRVQINTLVTSRLERYRKDTVAWLRRQRIAYKQLIMHPAGTAQQRRQLGDHAKRKAQVYRDPRYGLFVESSEKQAQEIYRLTRKPVLCTDTMCLAT